MSGQVAKLGGETGHQIATSGLSSVSGSSQRNATQPLPSSPLQQPHSTQYNIAAPLSPGAPPARHISSNSVRRQRSSSRIAGMNSRLLTTRELAEHLGLSTEACCGATGAVRHASVAKPSTITELRWRLKQSEAKFGTVPLVELERMADEIAGWVRLHPGAAPVSACGRDAAGARGRRPLRISDPQPREARRAEPDARAAGDPRLHACRADAITEELGAVEAAAVRFAAATGLRPSEWASVERRDVDKARRVVLVRGTRLRSRREVPLTTAALQALDRCLPGWTAATCSRPRGGAPAGEPGPFDVANFRRRVWGPAIDSAGIAKPARLYDLRSTFASNALAAGNTMFELARIMGTNAKMIEPTTGR